MKLDSYEAQILRVLQRQGRAANVDVAKRIGLSESPCLRRIKALEEAGIIECYAAILDQNKVGLHVTAFVQVSLNKGDEEKRLAFIDQVQREEQIIECHVMSGSYDYLLKVVAGNMHQFSELCMKKILNFAGVTNIETHFSLEVVKENSPLPINLSSS